MEDDNQNDEKASITCQTLFASSPEDILDRQDHKRGALGEDRSNTDGQTSEEEEMDVDRPHVEKTFKQHYEAKEGPPQE